MSVDLDLTAAAFGDDASRFDALEDLMRPRETEDQGPSASPTGEGRDVFVEDVGAEKEGAAEDADVLCCQATGPCTWNVVCRSHVPSWERAHGVRYVEYLRSHGHTVPAWLEGGAPGQRGSTAATTATGVGMRLGDETEVDENVAADGTVKGALLVARVTDDGGPPTSSGLGDFEVDAGDGDEAFGSEVRDVDVEAVVARASRRGADDARAVEDAAAVAGVDDEWPALGNDASGGGDVDVDVDVDMDVDTALDVFYGADDARGGGAKWGKRSRE